MRSNLCCDCTTHLASSEVAVTEDLLARFDRETPWDSLGDGQTFEDLIYQKLIERGDCCPSCGQAVEVSEEALGRMTMEMLAHM